MEPGFPLLLALGPAAGLLCGHLAGKASALPGPLLIPHPVCPDLRTPLPASPLRVPALRLARLPGLGSPSGHPTAVPVHLPQVRADLGADFLGSSVSTFIAACATVQKHWCLLTVNCNFNSNHVCIPVNMTYWEAFSIEWMASLLTW